jgi:acyl dehydratase
MPRSLASLPKDHHFLPIPFDLPPQWVDDYVAAVEDQAVGDLGPDLVPPVAPAAKAIRAVLDSASLPPGAVHISQELAMLRSVRAGERLSASAHVASRGERQGWVLMSIDLSVQDESGEPVLTGRATLTMPSESESG